MKRTPRLRLGSMADVRGAGSLIRVVRRTPRLDDHISCMKTSVVAFLVLLLFHTAVSFIAYRLSTTTWTVSDSASGELAAFPTSTPGPVVLYIIFGYAGLIISALWGLVAWLWKPV